MNKNDFNIIKEKIINNIKYNKGHTTTLSNIIDVDDWDRFFEIYRDNLSYKYQFVSETISECVLYDDQNEIYFYINGLDYFAENMNKSDLDKLLLSEKIGLLGKVENIDNYFEKE